MSVISAVVLTILGVCSIPLYFRRVLGPGTLRVRIGAVVLLVLLGIAAVTGLTSGAGLGPAVVGVAVFAAALGGGPVTVAILGSAFQAQRRVGGQDERDRKYGSGSQAAPDDQVSPDDQASPGATPDASPATAAVVGAASARETAADADAQLARDEGAEALRGGAWIGLLERIAISATLLAGWPAGMAVVLAVKGLGRYSELGRSTAAAERFILGTFASVLWAAAATGVGFLIL